MKMKEYYTYMCYAEYREYWLYLLKNFPKTSNIIVRVR